MAQLLACFVMLAQSFVMKSLFAGVMCYEAVVHARALRTEDAILQCAHSVAAYPWELPVQQQPVAWRQSRVRALVMPECVRRYT